MIKRHRGVRTEHIYLRLRADQVDFLETSSRWEDDAPLSAILGDLIERYGQRVAVGHARAERKHLHIAPEHKSLLETLAAKLGIEKSDVAQGVIDLAIQAERGGA